MHSIETRNEFLKLRLQGWSFARISTQIGVSKPTLIDWSRRRESELLSLNKSTRARLEENLQSASDQEFARLTTCLNSLRQELLSRELRSISTDQLESLATGLERQLDTLKAVKKTHLPSPSMPPPAKAGKG